MALGGAVSMPIVKVSKPSGRRADELPGPALNSVINRLLFDLIAQGDPPLLACSVASSPLRSYVMISSE
jgi:hypothetical protein